LPEEPARVPRAVQALALLHRESAPSGAQRLGGRGACARSDRDVCARASPFACSERPPLCPQIRVRHPRAVPKSCTSPRRAEACVPRRPTVRARRRPAAARSANRAGMSEQIRRFFRVDEVRDLRQALRRTARRSETTASAGSATDHGPPRFPNRVEASEESPPRGCSRSLQVAGVELLPAGAFPRASVIRGVRARRRGTRTSMNSASLREPRRDRDLLSLQLTPATRGRFHCSYASAREPR